MERPDGMIQIYLGAGLPIITEPRETAPHTDDPIAQELRTARNCFQLILALGESFEVALEQVVLKAKDDNVREVAQRIKQRHRSALGVYADTMDGDDPDWRFESPIALLRWCESEAGTETLLIPELRRKIRSVLEGEYTEEEFDSYLEFLRKMYRLSEAFK